MLARTISVAPMMGWTDRHARYFLRLITRHTLLYTEMVTTGAILHGHREQLLKYHPAEHPLALQLGGSDPAELAECALIAEDYGFDEINLNVGCPSDRVQSGRFGACLMAEPSLVAECVAAMISRVKIPVTVKCRIGIDDMEEYAGLAHFVDTVADTGCDTFIVHARKAWLQGLSPKQNRDIPPLRYDLVHQLKQERPKLNIVINGGIKTIDEVSQQLLHVDGVMLGREAYHNPWLLAEVDREFYSNQQELITREQVIESLLSYIDDEMVRGTRLHAITRHIYGLFVGCPGARAWRRELSTSAHYEHASSEMVTRAWQRILAHRAS
jgi:tRNA-dihydrouridine synthase A